MIPANGWQVQFGRLLEQRVRELESDNECIHGFRVARISHGILVQLGIDPLGVNPCSLESELYEALRSVWNCEEVLEELVHRWPLVKYPDGVDFLEYAQLRANRDSEQPSGRYLTKQQPRVAWLWRLLSNLPAQEGHEGHVVFLSAKQAANLLQVNEETARRDLDALVREGAIEVVQRGAQGLSTRYRILGHGKDYGGDKKPIEKDLEAFEDPRRSSKDLD